MRTIMAGLLVAALSLGPVTLARAELTPAGEAGFSILAAFSNVFYTPAKLTIAGVGLAVGAVNAWAAGGDQRAAYAIWVPTVGGTYFLRVAHFAGDRPVELFGCDYADSPSKAGAANNESVAYRAAYVTP